MTTWAIQHWLIRLPVVVPIAVAMGYFGLALMFLAIPGGAQAVPRPGDLWANHVMAASALLWTVMSLLLRRERRLSSWALWGLLSPMFGCVLVAPPASFAFVGALFYVAGPVGVVTGLLVGSVFRLGTAPEPARRLRAAPRLAPG